MIYVVTKGSCSCYHIVGVTSDHDIAEKIAAKFSDEYDDCVIEEYVDGEVMLRPAFDVWCNKDGSVSSVERCVTEYDYAGLTLIEEYRRGLKVTVSADTEEAAVKIAAEKRAQWLAEKNGL